MGLASRAGLRGLALTLALALTAWSLLAAGRSSAATGPEPAPQSIATDRTYEVLPRPVDGDLRATLRTAARELGSWTLELAGARVNGDVLRTILERPDPELLRAAREQLRLPIDLDDLLLFVDDVLVAGRSGLRGQRVYVPSGRARSAGLLVHPQEVFEGRPRRYGERDRLEIDRPEAPQAYPEARDGEVLGPNWTMRYANPTTERVMLDELRRVRPDSALAERIESLIGQLREQGADVVLTSTVRPRERGYLMWGAFLLSRATARGEVERTLTRLQRANREWQLDIPIRWAHPEGWGPTVEAAREMADTYEVVYATEQGARSSNHYTGVAVDLVAIALPRELRLRAPDGTRKVFDLSAPAEPRDLSVSPAIIDWIESKFEIRKLRSDYPHWDDVRAESVAQD